MPSDGCRNRVCAGHRLECRVRVRRARVRVERSRRRGHVRALDDGDSAAPRVLIDDIVNDQGRLPRDPARNTASVAVQALARGDRRAPRHRADHSKGIAAVERPRRQRGQRGRGRGRGRCAARRQRVARDPDGVRIRRRAPGAGSAHGDNIAPAVYGGFVLVRVANPPDIDSPADPARSDRGRRAPGSRNRDRARAGAARCDGAARGCHPAVGESRRASSTRCIAATSIRSRDRSRTRSPNRAARRWCPGSRCIKRAAADAGALGCSLSGSGPSLFALCRDGASASAVAAAMTAAVKAHIGGEPQTYVSAIAPGGARVVVPASV